MTGNGERHVLLDAYQCGPGLGSVSQIGWEWFVRLSARTRVTLLTHVRNRPVIEAAGVPKDARILYVDTEWLAAPLYRLAKRLFPRSEHAVFALSSLDFLAYDAACLRRARAQQAAGDRFDVVHVVTPVSPAAATRLHRLGPPVIRGPLNGGLGDAPGFGHLTRAEGSWVSRLRGATRLVDVAFGSSRHAALVLTATEATRAALPASARARCETMLENGVDLQRFRATPWPPSPSPQEALRVLFVGRLVPVKALPLLLEAVAEIGAEGPIHVRVAGEGPMADAWRAHAQALGLADRVTFLGALTLDAVADELAAAHLLCLPSIRESGGSVVLEALASARPALVARAHGPGELVDDAVGRAVSATSPDALRAGLAEALRDVMRHPEAWAERGREGRRRAEREYDWERKIARALELYARLAPEPS